MPSLWRRKSQLVHNPGPADLAGDPRSYPRPPATASSSTRPSGLLGLPQSDSQVRPASEHGYSSHLSPLAHDLHPDDISDSGADDVLRNKSRRFSLMKFRNFSETHLATRAKLDTQRGEGPRPPIPTLDHDSHSVPAIVKTAPTMDNIGHAAQPTEEETERQDKETKASRFKRASAYAPTFQGKGTRKSMDEKRNEKASKPTSLRWRKQGKNSGLADLHHLSAKQVRNNQQLAPPGYGDESNSAAAIPVVSLADPRLSESSRSDASSGDGHIYASTTTTHTVSTHTTFFKLPKRNKTRNSIFPLPSPLKLPPPGTDHQVQSEGPATPRASTSAYSTHSFTPGTQNISGTVLPNAAALQRRHTEVSPTKQRRRRSVAAPSANATLARGSLSFAEPGMNLFRQPSRKSHHSASSSPLHRPARLGMRERSSTTSSFGRGSQDVETPPPLSASGRTSTSTNGRSSFGGLLTLSRFRQGSDPHSPRHGSPGATSKSNSFAMSREALVVPEREEGDTPGKYLERLEAAVSRSIIAGILSKSADPFAQAVLRSYTRRFPFFGEPIDMSLRKFLLEAELPKETQQVDRVIQAFADRYHECNPGIFVAPDQAYVIAFSIMMLHTDAFNKNNKRKMQKHDYIKNTSGQGLSDDILACFFDNICYTPFVHYEEEVDINGERVLPFKPKKGATGKFKSAIPGADAVGKKPSGPVDPYNLLVEQRLDILRPPIKDSMTLEDPYNYTRAPAEIDVNYLQRAFTHTGVLQIISARSRPAAYENQMNNSHPNEIETQQGIVDLKITKVGVLWRKSTKKKKTRSPWSEWGAILTGSQLYLFKNVHWAKGLVHQFTSQQRPGLPRTPVVFKPPISDFKPDALIKTDNAVALVDSTYTRHKNAFTFVRPGGQEEVLLAENEGELNDWLGLINYAAAFRAAGVRIRGMLGGNEDELRAKDVQRLDSTNSIRSISDESTELAKRRNRGLDQQLQRQVMAARRQIMVQKIGELEKEISDANRHLDGTLRNGRHLLVLAPIPNKTRDEVVHAAARTDANLKWLRRDIWRMKCHRDFLSMDVKLDGLSAAEIEKLQDQAAVQHAERESASKKGKSKILPRLSSSREGNIHIKTQSPASQLTSRASDAGSVENWMNGDVFRTPPESTAASTRDEIWQLPPLNLDTNSAQEQKRPSISGTLLSASSHGAAQPSLSHASSQSSMTHTSAHTLSIVPTPSSQMGVVTPIPSLEDREVEALARSNTALEPATSASAMNGAKVDSAAVSPSDGKQKGVRRSLHKTLRDHHHHHNSHHRHRRGKDSESTVRSGPTGDDKEAEDGTPGLARDKPRFILHGKQASVVQFGGDWERMKLRREIYNSEHPAAVNSGQLPHGPPLPDGLPSPIVQDFPRASEDGIFTDAEEDFEDEDEGAYHTEHHDDSEDTASVLSAFADYIAYDPLTEDDNRRQTVIGPGFSLPGTARPDSSHHGWGEQNTDNEEKARKPVIEDQNGDDCMTISDEELRRMSETA